MIKTEKFGHLHLVYPFIVPLSLLLFAIVMEALSHECHIGSPWELLYADYLVIMSDNLEDLKIQLHKSLENIPTNLGSKNKCGQD